MKNKIFTLIMLLSACSVSFQVNAQLTVSSSGNVSMPQKVAVGNVSVVDSVLLNVGSISTSNHRSFGVCATYAMVPGTSATYGCYASVLGKIVYDNTVYPPNKGTNPRLFTQFKAGVAGVAATGCGVYGAQGSTLPNSWSAGNFAGYFSGNVKVTGTLTAATVNTTSDLRLKTDISGLDDSSLRYLSSLRPVSFTFNNKDSLLYLDEGEDKRTHYGMIAQEVKEVLPELVSEDAAGYLSVNYIELIPLLIQAVKEQQSQIQELQSALSCTTDNTTKKNARAEQQSAAYLLQNTPNPFSQNSTIGYYLPLDTREAAIHVYDMSGIEIVAFPIDTYGQGELVIDGGSLRAGMYLYALIADGELIDTKQMILTK